MSIPSPIKKAIKQTAMKHTKGPWHIMDGGFEKNKNQMLATIYATNDDLEIICKVVKDGMLAHSEQDFKANAKLIAAAPDMLFVLKNCFTYLESCMDSWEEGEEMLYVEVREAIKRATE